MEAGTMTMDDPGRPVPVRLVARRTDPGGALTPTRPAAARADVTDTPDADLVALAIAEPARFATLYERYFDIVFGYCRRRLDDPTAAEDACAAIFSRAFAALATCQQPDRFRSWLFTIAHHEITDRYRQRQPPAPLDAVAWTLRDPERSPEEQAIVADERRSLYAALDSLPTDQRRVIELRLSGLSGPEIAAVIGRRHGAIRALQHRAFNRLRVLLADLDRSADHPDRDPSGSDNRGASR